MDHPELPKHRCLSAAIWQKESAVGKNTDPSAAKPKPLGAAAAAAGATGAKRSSCSRSSSSRKKVEVQYIVEVDVELTKEELQQNRT